MSSGISDIALTSILGDIYRRLTKTQYEDLLISLELYGWNELRQEHGDYHGMTKRELMQNTLEELRETHVLHQLIDELNKTKVLSRDTLEALSPGYARADDPEIDQSESRNGEGKSNALGNAEQPDNQKKGLHPTVIAALVTATATIVAAIILYFAQIRPAQLELRATQTAEARKTVVAATDESLAASQPDGAALPPSPTLEKPLESAPEVDQPEFTANCLAGDKWTPLDAETLTSPSEGCWPIPSEWGLVVRDNGLSVFRESVAYDLEVAIFRSLGPEADISFNLKIESMAMPAVQIANVSFGIININPPTPLSRGLFYQKEKSDFPVILKHQQYGPDIRNEDDERLEYVLRQEQRLKFSLRDNMLEGFVNDIRVLGPIEVSSPDRAFWIGYRVPIGGSLSFEITGFQIQEPPLSN